LSGKYTEKEIRIFLKKEKFSFLKKGSFDVVYHRRKNHNLLFEWKKKQVMEKNADLNKEKFCMVTLGKSVPRFLYVIRAWLWLSFQPPDRSSFHRHSYFLVSWGMRMFSMCLVIMQNRHLAKLIKLVSTQKKNKCQIKTCILKLTRSLFRIYATIYNLLRKI